MKNICLNARNKQVAPTELLWRSCVFCYKQVAPDGAKRIIRFKKSRRDELFVEKEFNESKKAP